MAVQLRAVSPREIPELWPQVRDRIASCCARSGGKYAPIDVLRHLIAGSMTLWLATDQNSDSCEPPSGADASHTAEREGWCGGSCEAAGIKALAITELAAYPRITVCKLLACTGDDAALWVDLLAPMEAWAKQHGCAVLEPICRPGWERRLKPQGYRKTHVVLEKLL